MRGIFIKLLGQTAGFVFMLLTIEFATPVASAEMLDSHQSSRVVDTSPAFDAAAARTTTHIYPRPDHAPVHDFAWAKKTGRASIPARSFAAVLIER